MQAEKCEEMERSLVLLKEKSNQRKLLNDRIRNTVFTIVMNIRGVSHRPHRDLADSSSIASNNMSEHLDNESIADTHVGESSGRTCYVSPKSSESAWDGEGGIDIEADISIVGSDTNHHERESEPEEDPQRFTRTDSGSYIHMDDESGALYKINAETGESTWLEADSGEVTLDTEQLPLPLGWEEFFDEDGDAYYYQESTQKTTWTRPT